MRSIVLTIISVTCMIFIVLTILTISGHVTRENEFEESLATALNAAMDNVTFTEGFTKENYMTLIGDLQQDIIIQLNSDGDIEIQLLEINLDEGILDIEVTQTYKWAGKDKKVSVRRTIILDEFNDSTGLPTGNTYFAKFFVYDEELTEFVELTENRQEITSGDVIKKPKIIPEKPGKEFVGWYLSTDDINKQVFEDNEWSMFTITENMDFIALFK